MGCECVFIYCVCNIDKVFGYSLIVMGMCAESVCVCVCVWIWFVVYGMGEYMGLKAGVTLSNIKDLLSENSDAYFTSPVNGLRAKDSGFNPLFVPGLLLPGPDRSGRNLHTTLMASLLPPPSGPPPLL